MSAPLDRLGWHAGLDSDFSPYAATCLPGRVARAERTGCLVLTAAGVLRAGASARLRLAAASDPTALPTVGDWVAVRAADGTNLVEAVLPRSSAFVRGTAGDAAVGQVLAANVDTAFIVVALSPPPNHRRLERFLALAWESGAQPVVVLTKADLHPDPTEAAAEIGRVAPGVPVHPVSARTGEGLDALAEYVAPGRSVALLGTSGAGKSTLVNTLAGEELMATTEIRDDGKGRHTTTHRELLVLPGGGIVVDTPGLRGVRLWDAEEGLATAFADVEELARECRFHDCAHDTEPGCAVRDAVDPRRLDSWRRLRREMDWQAVRTDARARAERAKKWKVIAKANRSNPGRPQTR